jgi:hypothetical protein
VKAVSSSNGFVSLEIDRFNIAKLTSAEARVLAEDLFIAARRAEEHSRSLEAALSEQYALEEELLNPPGKNPVSLPDQQFRRNK